MRCLGVMLCGLARLAVATLATLACAQPSPTTAADARAPAVLVLRIDGAIGPAAAEHVRHGLQRAAERRARLVVLQLDTPGGLDASMRSIVRDILASPVPVAAYVAPQGARAASAGTYIVYASHFAAMAPATALGAATPVVLGTAPPPASAASSAGLPAHDAMEAKRVNDAAAYIRALALLRGRNAEWAERAVRDAVSLPSSEALAQKVVDVVAVDVPDLLRQLDGRTVAGSAATHAVLAVAGAAVETVDVDWRGRVLAVIGEPSLALLLMTMGFYGLLFELANPGFVLPGVVGGVCLLLGLFGLQTLPVNYAGLALVLLGLGFFVAEAFVPAYGALGLGGAIAFALGAVMLFEPGAPGFGVPRALIYALALASLGFVLLLAALAARTRRRTIVGGAGGLVGRVGKVIEANGANDAQGWVEVAGERWQARSAQPLRVGDRVRVRRVDGLALEVEGG